MILTPTKTKATTSTTTISNSKTLNALQLKVTDLEKDVKELKDVDNSIKVISTIQSEFPKAVKEYLRSILDDPMYKLKVPKETITSFDTTALAEFDQKTTLFETMNKSKSFNKSLKQRALYHALMGSILEDEDAMDEGVADKLKKRKRDDVDKDEGPSAGSDRGLKRQKTSCVELKYNIEECYKAVTDRLDWNNPEGKEYSFDLSKPLSLIMNQGRQVVPIDYFINNDLEYLRGGSSSKKYTTSTTKTKAAKYDILGIEDMVPSLWSPVKVAYDRHAVWGNFTLGP
ncbi:hypothetical protein Tco_0660507 [Tanacetum coccineum]